MKITIPDYLVHSRNKTATAHWRRYQEEKHDVADLVRCYAGRVKLFEKPVVITITAFFKGAKNVDPSNIDDKVYVDAVMRAGIIVDDNTNCNPTVIKHGVLNAEENRVEIEINEI